MTSKQSDLTTTNSQSTDAELSDVTNVKAAVKIASSYLAEMIEDAKNIQLEEVYTSPNDQWWMVTISFEIQKVSPGVGALVGHHAYATKYKVLGVNRVTGSVDFMRIRDISKPAEDPAKYLIEPAPEVHP